MQDQQMQYMFMYVYHVHAHAHAHTQSHMHTQSHTRIHAYAYVYIRLSIHPILGEEKREGGREGGISINDIPDCDGHVHTYVHHENRSLIQSLALMRSAIIKVHVCTSGMCEWYMQMCMSVCTCTCYSPLK